MGYDAATAERLRAHFAGRADVAEKRMVGGLSFVVNGNMCCGVTGSALMVRVGSRRTPRSPPGCSAASISSRRCPPS